MRSLISLLILVFSISAVSQAASAEQMYRVYYAMSRCDWTEDLAVDRVFPISSQIVENGAKASARYKKENHSLNIQFFDGDKEIYSTRAFNPYRKSEEGKGDNTFPYTCNRGGFFDVPERLLSVKSLKLKLHELTVVPRNNTTVLSNTLAEIRSQKGNDPVEEIGAIADSIYKGKSDIRFKMLVLGDGFTPETQKNFKDWSDKHLPWLVEQNGYKEIKDHIEVQRVTTPKQLKEFPLNTVLKANKTSYVDSDFVKGLTHFEASYKLETISVKSPFGSFIFDNDRGAPVMNTALYYDLQDRYQADNVIILINSDRYCGYSNDMVSVCIGQHEAPYVLTHELGHSLGFFKDTYYYGGPFEGPRSSKDTTPSEAGVNIALNLIDVPWVKYITNPARPAVHLASPMYKIVNNDKNQPVALVAYFKPSFASDKIRIVGDRDQMSVIPDESLKNLMLLDSKGQRVPAPLEIKKDLVKTMMNEYLHTHLEWNTPLIKDEVYMLVFNGVTQDPQFSPRHFQIASRDFSLTEISIFEGSGAANIGEYRPTFLTNTSDHYMPYNAYEKDLMMTSMNSGFTTILCVFKYSTCVR